MSLSHFIDTHDKSTPMFTDHGLGIHTIDYYWRDAATALCEFRKKFPQHRITAIMETKKKQSGTITLIAELRDASAPNTQ